MQSETSKYDDARFRERINEKMREVGNEAARLIRIELTQKGNKRIIDILGNQSPYQGTTRH